MAEVRAELVANVVSVFVDEGEAVEDGDTLVMLESMKMEIPVVAEGDGTVRKVVVKEGDTVQRGDLIAVVD
jgi:biotin carboxyl carrier protein